MRISVIIPAAGSSTRYNQATPQSSPGQASSDPLAALGTTRSKLDEDLGGKAVLQRTIELFNTRDDVHQIIVAAPHDQHAFTEFKAQHGDRLALLGATLTQGGKAHRWESVRAALQLVDDQATHIAIHDAARPATKPELIDRIFEAAKSHPAVIPGNPISDTLKRVDAEPIEDAGGIDQVAAILGVESNAPMHKVVSTIDRSNAMAIQTPQIFERDLLIRAYAQDDLSSTDDAGLIERLGEPVIVIAGDPTNMKLTHANELPLLRAIMGLKKTAPRPTHKRF
ncbi:MAG: IspD/TarI family cytidylyltransferase [Phycisphaerales bacterium]